MLPAVTEVSPRPDHEIGVVFENGDTGVLDMKPYLDFGVFRRIRDEEEFRKVRVSFDTVEWACGVDLDPEFVHARCRRGG
jgi:hypothetical protein